MKKSLSGIIAALVLSAGSLFAATWVGTTVNWNTGSNWSPAGAPNTLGKTAVFTGTKPGNVNLGAVTNIIGAGSQSLDISAGTYTFLGSATGLLVIDANTDVANNTFSVRGTGQLTADANSRFAFRNSATTDHGFAKTRMYTSGGGGTGGKLTFNGSIAAETSMDIRTAGSTDILALNGNIALSANRGLWFSSAAAGSSLSLNGKVTGSGTSFVELGADMRLGNASGAAIDSSVSRVGITQSAKVTLDFNDQIAANIDTVDTATGGTDGNRTLDLNGHNNIGTGSLKLGDLYALNINFSNAANESVWFADSSALAWNGSAVLNLIGFTTNDTLRFGTSASGLTAQQLSQITVNGAAGTYGLDSNGYFGAIPEPATIGMLGLGSLVVLIMRRMRQ